MPPRLAAIRAISATSLRTELKKLGVKQGSFAVALSGGPDSLALTALLAQLGPVTAFIVDHGLRAESATEAKAVQRRARALGVKAHILKWQGAKPATGIMAAARAARYQLLVEAAQKHKCTHLFLGHHADDQLETVAMRMAEGSGWHGLAGMPATAQLGNVTLVRPLLRFTKAQLVATCEKLGLVAVDDPSNKNPKYTRARLRLDAPNYKGVLAKQQKAAARRNRELAKLVQGQAYELHEGWASYSKASPDLLKLLLQHIGQEDKPIRQEALIELQRRLKAGQGATLAGCIIKGGIISREPSAITPMNLAAGRHYIWWDRRWQLSFRLKAPQVLGALGKNANWRALRGTEWLESIPGAARAALPALWQDGRLVAVLKGRWLPYYHPMRSSFVEK